MSMIEHSSDGWLAEARLAEALGSGAPTLFALLAERLAAGPGYRLLTLLAPNAAGDRLDRLHSTDLEQYPIAPADPVEDNRWFEQLFTVGKPIVANSAAEIAEWLPDFTDFEAQGYGSLLNLPVVYGGATIGLINMMDREGHFDDANVAAVMSQVGLAALIILGAGKVSTIRLAR
ncbi:MAG: GAF domain-containing protein [Ancalomicrobiaceae bacterium]|nr:GAF domain-containing protein [Ancalomicrobiaceae bacterium]